MKLAYHFAISAFALLFLSSAAFEKSHADESARKQIEDKSSDVKTDAKKEKRSLKRHARKAIGTDSQAKDLKDKANDVGDDIHNTAKKATN